MSLITARFENTQVNKEGLMLVCIFQRSCTLYFSTLFSSKQVCSEAVTSASIGMTRFFPLPTREVLQWVSDVELCAGLPGGKKTCSYMRISMTGAFFKCMLHRTHTSISSGSWVTADKSQSLCHMVISSQPIVISPQSFCHTLLLACEISLISLHD